LKWDENRRSVGCGGRSHDHELEHDDILCCHQATEREGDLWSSRDGFPSDYYQRALNLKLGRLNCGGVVTVVPNPGHRASIRIIRLAHEDCDVPIANLVACIKTVLQRQVPTSYKVGAPLQPHLRPNSWMTRAPPTGTTSFHQVLARRTGAELCLISTP
jgi:hypothetical protein